MTPYNYSKQTKRSALPVYKLNKADYYLLEIRRENYLNINPVSI
ncbi:MAG: hypothetical protein JWQ66_1579 [Mucilaginibacter sp.]|jgi:hypothetical protein|nr:hypothetical protein [Mucilaginibacter sp.]